MVYVVSSLFVSVGAYARSSYIATTQKDSVDRSLEMIRLLMEEAFLEQAGDELGGGRIAETELEEVMVYFEELLKNPLNINGARRGELDKLLVLTQFQIESILYYREHNGYILSPTELSLLHGFDDEVVALILPFISFDLPDSFIGVKDGNYGFKDFLNDCSSQLYFKGATDLQHNEMYVGTPYFLHLKYKVSYSDKITAGFTLENDIGETLFKVRGTPIDFFSFHAALHNVGKINTIVIGDYSARLGQGLVLWNSFRLMGSSIPSSLFKRGCGVLPYTSSDENRFFRGVAASFTLGQLDVNAMLSYNRLDARVKDGKYTSIIDGGMHNTLSLLEARKSMKEALGAFSLKYRFTKFHVGLNFAAYGYNRSNGKRVSEYNRYQMYDGVWGNSSVDFYGVHKNLRFFGEFAVDFGGSTSLLAGALFPIFDKLECGLLIRTYSKSYIAPHAGAYSSLSSVSNQSGFVFDLSYSVSNSLKFSLHTEPVYYPWCRYNVQGSSYMLKEGVAVQFDNELWNGYINFTHTHYSHNGIDRIYLKSKFTFDHSTVWRSGFHGAIVSAGSAGYEVGTDLRYKSMNRRLTINSGMVLFCCKGWSERLYIYENNLPYTYSSRLLYGNGISIYILFDYTLCKGVDIYLKNGTQCYFSDNKEPQSELKLAAKLSF